MNEVAEVHIDFDALEAKVGLAVELIQRLKEENLRLSAENSSLKLQVESSGGASRAAMEELNNQVSALEKETSALHETRRTLSRRIEETLSKLEFLESESVSH